MRMNAQLLRSFFIAALVAAVLYFFVQYCNSMNKNSGAPKTSKDGKASKEDKKKHGTDKKKQVEDVACKSGGDASPSHKPLKGVAPQKIDLFVQRVCAAYPDVTPEAARAAFPRKFEAHGHVVVVRLNEGGDEAELKRFAPHFAAAFAPLLVDVVLLDTEGIVGELRRPKLELLYAAATALTDYAAALRKSLRNRWAAAQREQRVRCSVTAAELGTILDTWTASPTYTTHIENGVLYTFDVARVMFSSGNTTERMHFATIDATKETVVDMFCGIGYFTLPLAMHGKVHALFALEKNPDSVAFLKVNAVLNRVDHLVHPICGDNREVGSDLVGQCDRVLMGYIPSCKSFLPRALSFLKTGAEGRKAGIIHYHYLADKPHAAQEAMRDVREELGEAAAAAVRIADLRCVKSYAPKRFHYVADLVFS